MKKYLFWLPVLGLVFVFVWFGIDKFLNPQSWIFWQPKWMDGFLGQSKEIWNHLLAIAEIIMSILLLIPKSRWLGGLAITLYMLPIIQIGWPGDIAIRDIGLVTMSLYFFLDNLPASIRRFGWNS